MATGSGKTLVMAMLIAWQALNKLANPKDNRFSDAFLVVAPGITMKEQRRESHEDLTHYGLYDTVVARD